jgi:hypothetical protein
MINNDKIFDTKLLTCPITGKIFNQPVTTREGCTYELQVIKKYVRINKLGPTGLWVSNIFPTDHATYELVSEYLK